MEWGYERRSEERCKVIAIDVDNNNLETLLNTKLSSGRNKV